MDHAIPIKSVDRRVAAIRLAVTMDHAIPIKSVVNRRVACAANYASKRSGWNAPDRLQQKRLLTAKARMASYYAAIISIAFAIRLLHLQIGLKCLRWVRRLALQSPTRSTAD
jgi:hypothetical protein